MLQNNIKVTFFSKCEKSHHSSLLLSITKWISLFGYYNVYGCLRPFYLQYLSAFIFSLLSSISSWSFPSILAFFSLLVSCSLRRRFLSWKLWNFLTKLISWFRRSFSSSGRLLVHTLLQKNNKLIPYYSWIYQLFHILNCGDQLQKANTVMYTESVSSMGQKMSGLIWRLSSSLLQTELGSQLGVDLYTEKVN